MNRIYSTPGVYIEEKNAFTNAITPLESAIPCFIGFTEKAMKDSNSLSKIPTKISSLAEFNELFGGQPPVSYQVNIDANDSSKFEVQPDSSTQFYLYYSLKLFFNNGGKNCYIYSTGDYGHTMIFIVPAR